MYNNLLNIFIARRISSSAMTSQGKVMVRIAILSVAISVAIIVIAINIILGFKREITSKVVGFASHYKVVSLNDRDESPIKIRRNLEESLLDLDFTESIVPFVQKSGVLKSGESVDGVVLKGVDGSYDLSFFNESIVEGEMISFGDSIKSKKVLFSKSLSNKTGLQLGDKFEMMFISPDGVFRDRLEIGAIYQTSLEEFDQVMIIGDMRVAQRVSGFSEDEISGYELSIDDFDNVDGYLEVVEDTVFDTVEGDSRLMVVPITDEYVNIFDWLNLQDTNMWVIMTIMIFVAAFNTIAMLLIVLIDKSSMIGMLKALGLRDGDIQYIFILRSLYVVVQGLAWGVVIGLSLSLLQEYTRWLKLSEDAYFISYVPIEINYVYICTLVAISLIALVLFQLIPVKIISKMSPHRSIKFN